MALKFKKVLFSHYKQQFIKQRRSDNKINHYKLLFLTEFMRTLTGRAPAAAVTVSYRYL